MGRERTRAVGLTLFSAALWGTSFPVIKVALSNANPADFLFFRFLIATAILCAVFLAMHLDRKVFFNRNLAILGFVFSLSFYFQYIGQTGTGAGEAAVLINTSPIIVPLLSYFVIGEQLGAARYVAAAIGMVGILFMSGVLDPGASGSTLAGVLEMLASAISSSVYIIGTKRYSSVFRPMEFYPPVFFYGTLFMLLYALLSGGPPASIASGAGSPAAILYLAIACSILPFFLWYRGLQNLSATASTVVVLFEPVVAIVISVVFINEVFGVMQLVGTLLIFAAILFIMR